MRNKIAAFDCYRIENLIWFSNLSFNSLMQMNLNTREIKLVGRFLNYKLEQRNLHRRVYFYKDRLFFIPWFGKSIDRYDLYQNEFMSVDIYEMKTSIKDAVRIGNKIWVFPASEVDSVFTFDLESQSINLQNWVFDKIKQKRPDIRIVLSVSSIACENQIIWMGIYDKNIIFQIDTDKRTVQEILLPFAYNLKSVDICDASLWVSNKNYPTVASLKDKSFQIYYEEKNVHMDSFSRIIEKENFIIVLPHNADYILCYKKGEEVEKYAIPPEIRRCRMGPLMFAEEIFNDKCMFIPFSLDCILSFDLKKKQWIRSDYCIKGMLEEEIQKIFEMNIDQQKCTGEMGEGIAWENTLPIFIDKVQKQVNVQPLKSGINIGEQILKDTLSN